jgi:hypothetical protein
MDRRRFIQGAASPLLFPYVPAQASARANPPAIAAAPQWEWADADRLFYDDRFPQARRLARELSGSTEPTPVQGDITGIWNAGLGSAIGKSMLILQGVTAESFHFCLKIMVGEHARMETWVTRIDRDLFLWQIRCGQTIKQGHRA